MFSYCSFAEEDEYIMSNYYNVVSDVESDDVPNGKCIVKGQVINPYTEKGVIGGIVANLTRSSYAVTDDSGYYQITIPATDTTVFFYHEKYNEIICWSYPFTSGHIVTMNFFTNEKAGEGIIYEVEKPVIYLYPEKTTNVSINLDEDLDLSFTYPIYNDQWDVVAYPNGQLEIDGIDYPYLFWESTKNQESDASKIAVNPGYYIKTDTCIKFLENTLALLGLNERESTDFITYWGPRIQGYPYAVLEFYIDDSCISEMGNHKIKPEPDNMRRVYIILKGSHKNLTKIRLKTPVFDSFNRSGFTVIEWGGSEIKPNLSP